MDPIPRGTARRNIRKPGIRRVRGGGASDRYALFVVVSQHRDRTIPALPGVRCDARDLRNTLQEFADGGVHQLTWLTDEKATKQGILAAVRQIVRGAKQSDQVIVYLGGHGCRRPADPEAYFFVPYDATFDSVPERLLSTKELCESFQELRASEVVVTLDFCHSGGMATSFELSDQAFEDLRAGLRSYVVMAAARGCEEAGEEDRGGFFTQALCAAFRGEEVTVDEEGRVSAQEAFNRAEEKSKALAQRCGHQQCAVQKIAGSQIYLTRPMHNGRAISDQAAGACGLRGGNVKRLEEAEAQIRLLKELLGEEVLRNAQLTRP